MSPDDASRSDWQPINPYASPSAAFCAEDPNAVGTPWRDGCPECKKPLGYLDVIRPGRIYCRSCSVPLRRHKHPIFHYAQLIWGLPLLGVIILIAFAPLSPGDKIVNIPLAAIILIGPAMVLLMIDIAIQERFTRTTIDGNLPRRERRKR